MSIEALQTGLEYARLALVDHDSKYGRHPSMEFDRKVILDDIKLIEDAIDQLASAQEPFGYFRALPFGWEDCSESDDGAIPLYEHPSLAIRHARGQ